MRKLLLILLVICQSFAFAQGSIPEITPKSKMAEIIKYYDFVLNINGELNENKLEVFRQALSQYSLSEIATSGILEKAYEVSLKEFERIINKDFYSKVNFFANSSIEELTQFTLKSPIATFGTLLDRDSNYYEALYDLDPRSQTRRHNVTKIIEAIMDHADEVYKANQKDFFSLLNQSYQANEKDFLSFLFEEVPTEGKKLILSKQKDVLNIKTKAMQLFDRFNTIEQAELLSRIADFDIIKKFPSEVASSLQKNGNETKKMNHLILRYFSTQLSFKENELFLLNYAIDKNMVEMTTLFEKENKFFLSYLETTMKAFEDEHYGFFYDSYVYSEIERFSLLLTKILKTNPKLIPTYLNSLESNSFYIDYEKPLHRMVTKKLIKNDIVTDKIATHIFNAYETGKYNYTDKTKFELYKLLKEKKKLPPIAQVKKTRFYKQLSEKRYYRIKLWMLHNGCDGIFKK